MKISGQTIVTPLDDPMVYEVDWRHRVARALYDADPIAPLARDPVVRDLVSHFRYRAKRPLDRDLPRPLDRITRWHDQTTGRIIEAYLLTNATYEEIGVALGLDADEVKRYGELFYDVRDPQGRPLNGVLTRLRAELPDEPTINGYSERHSWVVWRACAALWGA